MSVRSSDRDVDHLVDEFAKQAKRHFDDGLEWGNKRITKETQDSCIAIAEQLSACNPSQRKALGVLLDDAHAGVRVMAACYFIVVDRDRAFAVLREIGDRNDGTEACISAAMNLFFFERGLEPV